MNSIRYSTQRVERLCLDVFQKMGFSPKDAAQITDVLLLADLYGIRSHGTQRLYRYYNQVKKGNIAIHAKPEVVFETPVSAVIDGHDGMGQLIGAFAMRLAIEKAKQVGMAFVSVRNSNHYGIAGYYSKMACDAGMIGISTTNSESIMVHTGSRQALLGSNPIAFAMPADPIPFWFDAATTVVPRGKLEVSHKEHKELDHGWAVDRTGADCTDPQHVLACINSKEGGGILPVGGRNERSGSHKGYGYSMICEILSAITSCGATSNHHVRANGRGAGSCHSFIAIRPEIFGDAETIRANLSTLLRELREAPRADERIPIYTHGEKEYLAYETNQKDGIEINVNTVSEIMEICQGLGLDPKEYLGDTSLLE